MKSINNSTFNINKRIVFIISFILVIAFPLLVSGKEKAKPIEKTMEELDTKFSYETATVLVNDFVLKYETFNEGEKLKVHSSDDNNIYYSAGDYLAYISSNDVKVDGDIVTIINDGAVSYIDCLDRGNQICITLKGEDDSAVLFAGRYTTIKSKYIRLNNDIEYEKWNGKLISNCDVFKDFSLKTKISTLNKGTTITVVDEVDDVYVIETEEGYAYLKKTSVDRSNDNNTNDYDDSTEWTDPIL